LYARLYSMQFRDPEEELAALSTVGDHEDSGETPAERPAGLLDMLLKRR